jgi:hypothetical protein
MTKGVTMLEMNIHESQYAEITRARLEQFRHQVELERQIPHTSWRHRIASTLIAWARRLEPEVSPSRTLTA